jgi:hypothetical protein
MAARYRQKKRWRHRREERGRRRAPPPGARPRRRGHRRACFQSSHVASSHYRLDRVVSLLSRASRLGLSRSLFSASPQQRTGCLNDALGCAALTQHSGRLIKEEDGDRGWRTLLTPVGQPPSTVLFCCLHPRACRVGLFCSQASPAERFPVHATADQPTNRSIDRWEKSESSCPRHYLTSI